MNVFERIFREVSGEDDIGDAGEKTPAQVASTPDASERDPEEHPALASQRRLDQRLEAAIARGELR